MKGKLALLILIVLATWVLYGNNTVGASDNPPPEQFLDVGRGTHLSIHSNPIDSNYGDFGFTIQGVGTYSVRGNRSIRPKDGGGQVINFKGKADFFSETGLQEKRKVVVNIETGPNDGFATAVLNDLTTKNKTHYSMVSRQPGQDSRQAVVAVGEALKNSDWSNLFGLVASTFVSGKTVDEFSEDLISQEQEIGQVIDFAVLSEEPNIQFSPLGVWVFTVKIQYTYNRNGLTEVQTATDYYIFEEEGWKFWFSVND